ncbi:MAG: addiction module protein [Terracidiphilus sp.]
MSRTAAHILEDARRLPPEDLEWLIQSLVNEGDRATDTEIEAAWDGEIKRRLDEIDSGAVEMLPLEDVLTRMDARIQPRKRG